MLIENRISYWKTLVFEFRKWIPKSNNVIGTSRSVGIHDIKSTHANYEGQWKHL